MISLIKNTTAQLSDAFAYSMTKFFRFIADSFFLKRYGHRAVVLETVAGVPGMVAGVWMHFKSLRKMGTFSNGKTAKQLCIISVVLLRIPKWPPTL